MVAGRSLECAMRTSASRPGAVGRYRSGHRPESSCATGPVRLGTVRRCGSPESMAAADSAQGWSPRVSGSTRSQLDDVSRRSIRSCGGARGLAGHQRPLARRGPRSPPRRCARRTRRETMRRAAPTDWLDRPRSRRPSPSGENEDRSTFSRIHRATGNDAGHGGQVGRPRLAGHVAMATDRKARLAPEIARDRGWPCRGGRPRVGRWGVDHSRRRRVELL